MRCCCCAGKGNAWQARLGVTSRAEAEASCAAQGQEHEWQADGSLTMFTQTEGFLRDDESGEAVWFNQASNFEAFTPTYGDGDPISLVSPDGWLRWFR